MREFPESFVKTFGYELRDPFDDICQMLSGGAPFSFSRFGDGEFNAIYGSSGPNTDGHQYFPDLRRRLQEIVESEPDYIMGLLPLAGALRGTDWIRSISGDVHWVSAESLHVALIEGRLGRFFDGLDGKDVALVGPEHLRPLSERRHWSYAPVPLPDCWTKYDEIIETLKDTVPGSGGVILFCAGLTTNVLIDDLYRHNPMNTYLDVGSVFDPLVGVSSRDYHEKLDAELLEALR